MRIPIWFLMLAACCFLNAAWEQPAIADDAQLTAKEVLDRMSQTYAGCNTYCDSGVVKTLYITAWSSYTVEKPFTTAFVRPYRFRFEYKESSFYKKRQHIIWCHGSEVLRWWSILPAVEKKESLGLALAGATGVSGGSAHTIPALLIPDEVGGRRLTEITDANRIEDARQDNADCFRITGQLSSTPVTIWIDKQSFLVRRIDERDAFDGFRTEDTTTYDPKINGEISESQLAFNLPSPVFRVLGIATEPIVFSLFLFLCRKRFLLGLRKIAECLRPSLRRSIAPNATAAVSDE